MYHFEKLFSNEYNNNRFYFKTKWFHTKVIFIDTCQQRFGLKKSLTKHNFRQQTLFQTCINDILIFMQQSFLNKFNIMQIFILNNVYALLYLQARFPDLFVINHEINNKIQFVFSNDLFRKNIAHNLFFHNSKIKKNFFFAKFVFHQFGFSTRNEVEAKVILSWCTGTYS